MSDRKRANAPVADVRAIPPLQGGHFRIVVQYADSGDIFYFNNNNLCTVLKVISDSFRPNIAAKQ